MSPLGTGHINRLLITDYADPTTDAPAPSARFRAEIDVIVSVDESATLKTMLDDFATAQNQGDAEAAKAVSQKIVRFLFDRLPAIDDVPEENRVEQTEILHFVAASFGLELPDNMLTAFVP